MERSSWPDERLDEKMAAIDQTTDRIYAELGGIRVEMQGMRRELREEMSAMRREFREEMRETRREFQAEMQAMRADFSSLQGRLVQIGFGLVGALAMSLTALVVTLV